MNEEAIDEVTFSKAKDMIPMEEVRIHFENLVCGNAKRKGCQVKLDYPNQFYCRVCMMLLALGSDFFADQKRLTDNILFSMNKEQHKLYTNRLEYNQKWLSNYPRGASL